MNFDNGILLRGEECNTPILLRVFKSFLFLVIFFYPSINRIRCLYHYDRGRKRNRLRKKTTEKKKDGEKREKRNEKEKKKVFFFVLP